MSSPATVTQKVKNKISLLAAEMTPEKANQVHKLAKLFNDYWSSYDRDTLIEQVKEIEGTPIASPTLLSTAELLKHLYTEDVRIWSHKSEKEISKEIKMQEMEG